MNIILYSRACFVEGYCHMQRIFFWTFHIEAAPSFWSFSFFSGILLSLNQACEYNIMLGMHDVRFEDLKIVASQEYSV
jgi:hypothetical protein